MPETAFAKIRSKVKQPWVICFGTTLLLGILAHLYKLTNWLPNWDSLVFRYDAQNMTHLGRWFLSVACGFSSYYELPWLSGILCLIFLALGAVCICEIFSVQKNITAALIGGITAVFPTVTSTLTYCYVADGYCMAFFFSCLAALLLVKGGTRNNAVAVLLITLSFAIYQAYITVTVILVLVSLIDDLLFQAKAAAASLKKAGTYILCGILGGALYYGILQLILTLSGNALLDYQGIENAMSLSGLSIYEFLYKSVHLFLDVFFDSFEQVNLYVILNCCMLAATALLMLVAALRTHIFTPWYRGVLLLLYVAATPFGASLLYLINPSLDYHNLMRMGYIGYYILFILFYERMSDLPPKVHITKAWGILLTTVLVIANMTVIANVSYHKLQMSYEKSYGTLLRITDRIEQTEGSENCDRILVIGALEGSKAYFVNLPPEITGVTDSYILRADDAVVGQSVLCSALNDYCGKNYTFLSGAEADTLKGTPAVQSMPCWPRNGCIQIQKDVIIIKLSENVE